MFSLQIFVRNLVVTAKMWDGDRHKNQVPITQWKVTLTGAEVLFIPLKKIVSGLVLCVVLG